MSEKKRGGWGIFFLLKSLLFLVVLAAAFCFGFGVAKTESAVWLLPALLVLTWVLGMGRWLTKGWVLSGWYHMLLGLLSMAAFYAGYVGGLMRSGVDPVVRSFFWPW